jgi:AcrR family transcriptional regulator
MASDMTEQVIPCEPGRVERGRVRSPRRSAVEARQLLLDVAMEMISADLGEFPSLERLAAEAGVHKMTIYRIFVSQSELARACAVSLRERNHIVWRQTAERCRNTQGCKVRALFRILSEELRSAPPPGHRLAFLTSRLEEGADMIREAVEARSRALRTFLLECLQERSGYDSIALVDELVLLWEGASIPSRSHEERHQLAKTLPAIIDRVMDANLVHSSEKHQRAVVT